MQNLAETAYINQEAAVPVHQLGELPISKLTQPRHMATMVTLYVDIQGLLTMLNRRHFLLLLILGVPPHTIDTVGLDLLSTSFPNNSPHFAHYKFGEPDLVNKISTNNQLIKCGAGHYVES